MTDQFGAPTIVGQRGKVVRLVQEWLCLGGHAIAIDGSFGPATEAAVSAFQASIGLNPTGMVDQQTHDLLVQPMRRATAVIAADGSTLGEAVVRHALQHLAEHPREVGGQNRGPWVRLYMDGNEGPDWPWCAGFTSYVLRQACVSTNRKLPIRTSPSCDSLAAAARERGRFVTEKQAVDRSRVPPGSLFLSRRTPTDWVHTGLVVDTGADHFETIEGNTNDAGDREGYEVCRRIRGYAAKDFVVVD